MFSALAQVKICFSFIHFKTGLYYLTFQWKTFICKQNPFGIFFTNKNERKWHCFLALFLFAFTFIEFSTILFLSIVCQSITIVYLINWYRFRTLHYISFFIHFNKTPCSFNEKKTANKTKTSFSIGKIYFIHWKVWKSTPSYDCNVVHFIRIFICLRFTVVVSTRRPVKWSLLISFA